MPNRLLRVNAYTTFDMVDATATGHDFEESALAVLNVTAPREEPDHVTLELELDNSQLDALPAHADRVTLSAAQARELAGALEKYAARVERAAADDSDDVGNDDSDESDGRDDAADGEAEQGGD